MTMHQWDLESNRRYNWLTRMVSRVLCSFPYQNLIGFPFLSLSLPDLVYMLLMLIFDILLFPTSSFTLTEFCMFSISQESFDLVVWEHIAFQKTFQLNKHSCCLLTSTVKNSFETRWWLSCWPPPSLWDSFTNLRTFLHLKIFTWHWWEARALTTSCCTVAICNNHCTL